MSSLLVFNRAYRLKIESVMLVFSTPLVYCCPSNFSMTSPPSPLTPFPKGGWGWGGGVLSCVVDHILQEFDTLLLTRFRTYKIATLLQKNDDYRRHLVVGVFKTPSSMGLMHKRKCKFQDLLNATERPVRIAPLTSCLFDISLLFKTMPDLY
jgi:hypothetical protein